MNGKIIFVNTITQLALSATNSQLQGDIPDQQMDFMGQGGGGESHDAFILIMACLWWEKNLNSI